MSPDAPDSPARRLLREHVLPPRNDPSGGPAARGGSARSAPVADAPTAARSAPRRQTPAAAPAAAPGPFARWLADATRGRSWVVRAPLLPVLAWIAWKHAGDIWWGSLFSGINLAFHEIGHVLFGFFGNEFLTIAGGTILEVAIPVVAAGMLVRQRDAFGVGVCVFWLGTAFADVGRYIYDTRSQIFGRVSVGPYSGPDDWTYLLSRWDLIRQDRVIGMNVKEVGVALMAAGILWCAFTLWKMRQEEGG